MTKLKNQTKKNYAGWLHLAWIVFSIATYLVLNYKYQLAFKAQHYALPLLFSVVLLCVLGWLQQKTKLLRPVSNVLGLVGLSLLLMAGFFISFARVNSSIPFGANEFVHLSANYLWVLMQLFLVWLSAYAVGDKILSKFRWAYTEAYGVFYSLAIGQMVWTFMLFALGTFGFLSRWSVWVLMLVFLASNFKKVFSFGLQGLVRPFELKKERGMWYVLLAGMFCLMAGLNLVYNIKAFPIGWDAGSYYINISSLIDNSGRLVQGFQAYNQSLFGSLGLLAFNSLPGTFALVLSGGILTAGFIFVIVKRHASAMMGLLASLWFYTMPTVSFLSTKDVKIDLGLVFILLVTLMMYLDLPNDKSKAKKSVFVLIGLLLGFSVGIKYTAVFFAASLVLTHWYRQLGIRSTMALLLCFLSAFVLIRVDRISGVGIDQSGGKIVALVALILGVGYLFFKNKKRILPPLKFGLALTTISLLAFSPWLGKHFVENKSVRPMKLLFGKSEAPKLNEKFLDSDQIDIPEALFINRKEKKEKRSAKNEEILRYMGYERGITRFISLPFDVMNNLNIVDPYVHVGFIFLLLLPVLLWAGQVKNRWLRYILWLIPVWLAGVGLVSYMASSLNHPDLSVVQLIHRFFDKFNYGATLPLLFFKLFGYLISYLSLPILYLLKLKYLTYNFLTYPLSFLLALLGLYLLHHRFKNLDKTLKWMLISSYAFGVFWWIFGGGIVWYAYFLLVTVIILAAVGLQKQIDEGRTGWLRYPIFASFGLWFLMAVLLRLAGLNPETKDLSKKLFVPEMFQYASGTLEKDEVLGKMFPQMDKAVEILNESDGKIYRVGSYLPYFVKNNNRRIFSDNQLDIHHQISKRFSSKEALASTLYRDGFRYIVVDLNTATIDNTPEQSLRNKFRAFMFFLFQNPRIQQVLTDRQVKAEVEGETKLVYEVFGSNETVAHPGSFAIFKILP